MSGQGDQPAKKAYVPPHRRRQLVPLTSQQRSDKQEYQRRHDDERPYFTRICCINLRRRPDRWKAFQANLRQSLTGNSSFVERIERWDAVDGAEMSPLYQEGDTENSSPTNLSQPSSSLEYDSTILPIREWDSTQNSKWDKHIRPPFIKTMTLGEVGCALSHVYLWRELLAMTSQQQLDNPNPTMLILEDDAVFYQRQKNGNNSQERGRAGKPIFLHALDQAFGKLPTGWDILYLGLSDRGERQWLEENHNNKNNIHHSFHSSPLQIRLFQPTYGFHTHAYALTASAAAVLLEHGPVQGPIDVWLADNQWFGLHVYAAVIANEGYKGTGAWLIAQDRNAKTSDVAQSACAAT